MHIWLIGADKAGSSALRQLRKNPAIKVTVSDTSASPKAVSDGILARVDHVESVTSVNINALAKRVKPDLILVDRGALMRSIGVVSGGAAFVESLQEEMATASEFPCVVI